MGLARDERRRNVQHAIRPSPLARHELRHRVIVLVDDVRTTGATLDACADVLLECGADEVRPVSVAVAE